MKCNVRFLDTGVVHQYETREIYVLDKAFQDLPNQAYYLHLTGITPADGEDDWDERTIMLTREVQSNWMNSNRDNIIYEANILFSLRNTVVVDIMRLRDKKRMVVRPLKTYFKDKSLCNLSNNNRTKVIEMAKNAGKFQIIEILDNCLSFGSEKQNNDFH